MQENRLPISFYQSFDTCTLARKLLGCELVHDSPDGTTSGIIVETEAYLADDPACHAFNRRTPRTEPMYAQAGTIYVYLIYGMYQCFNVVSNNEGIGEAVLIRALQPVQGMDLMELRRLPIPTIQALKPTPVNIKLKELCRGPGKLVRAMGIDQKIHNKQKLIEGPLYINAAAVSNFEITTSTRIGINSGTELQYRYYIKDNIFVSNTPAKK